MQCDITIRIMPNNAYKDFAALHYSKDEAKETACSTKQKMHSSDQSPTNMQNKGKVNCMDAVSRRLELLKLEGLGLTQIEIVKQLSQKAACAERTLYNDFETRTSWQPILQSVIKPGDVLLKITNRYEQIYRQASLRVLSSPNALVQLAALNVMLKANSLMFETAVLPDLMSKLKALEDKAKKGVFIP
jgi:hypothetical protein